MVTPDKKRRKKLAEPEPTPTPAPEPVPRLLRVRPGNKKKNKGASPEKQPPVYMVLAHGVEEEPTTHSVIEVAACAAARRLLNTGSGRGRGRGMSFAAVGTRTVGVGVELTTVYDPETSTERGGPRLIFPKVNPVLISISDDGGGVVGGGTLYALSRTPAVVRPLDFEPWFFVLDDLSHTVWRELPSPPLFPCRLNPLEFLDPPKLRVAAYALVGSHILLSVSVQQLQPQQQQEDKGTCAFDMDTEQWEMVHDSNLPFDGQALPLGSDDDHRFVAVASAAADVTVYRMVVGISAVTGKKELTIVALRVVVASNSKCRIVPGNLLCAMGKGSFASFEFRSIAAASMGKVGRARIVHRTYSLVDDGEDDWVVMVKKQDRQVYKLRDPSFLGGCSFFHVKISEPFFASSNIF
ncbi:uncharacterized protein [Oryza sativa Japonica Group]|uniref:Expressed protein n=2 Tax=Oryza sativa subsp. japonica TaxID=39947 RepID=Q2QRC0_ORYSJ|nr:uncharacterized protein LOC4352192 [Oryza sativa Japonica Group]XP_015619362.1 uncharacterized protein LOC4352192 [Oryza sativa Japonica Group]ABA98172.1 expressed protein [Oryza sativa Japonica Group]EAZ20438.1 hypothetical protein OsJ_36045 [Oryza sativa Japonica Group]KAF2907764.1 hypothetical protein DAI22_12g124000 [Oryza sativa Japonica Group]BAF29765.1 Os12g0467200 [Oryza sativa Japonica Group]BAG98024.1 unnamed protein product [Oryza sativa Japonica Group]|eukprot:NP_001066746.1 Os12g0467200 [Oryza sativa Japonica Group]